MRKHKHFKKSNYVTTTYMEVVPTNHVIERLIHRQKNDERIDRKKAVRIIKQQVKQSKLINIDGDKEVRVYNGYIYICKKEYNKLIVITLKLSKIRQKQYFSPDFSTENINQFERDKNFVA